MNIGLDDLFKELTSGGKAPKKIQTDRTIEFLDKMAAFSQIILEGDNPEANRVMEAMAFWHSGLSSSPTNPAALLAEYSGATSEIRQAKDSFKETKKAEINVSYKDFRHLKMHVPHTEEDDFL
jgi:hypothetical protein